MLKFGGKTRRLLKKWDKTESKPAQKSRITVNPTNKKILKNLAEDFGFNQKFIEPYIVDFVNDNLKIILEVDGYVYSKHKISDAVKDSFLKNSGYKIHKVNSDSATNKVYLINWFNSLLCARKGNNFLNSEPILESAA